MFKYFGNTQQLSKFNKTGKEGSSIGCLVYLIIMTAIIITIVLMAK